jgi:hypothetical protein
MFEDYRKSLKHPRAEELFDLWIYRPLGWVFVRLVHRTPITPNQVTVFSLAAALAAAWQFAWGGLAALGAAAGWYALSNVLDCADGQLARVQGSGTPNGRIVDGVADYVGTTAIFLSIGAGFSGLGMNLWPETVAAGLTSALHAAIFDHRQAAYIAASRGDSDFHKREMEKHSGGGAGGRAAGGGPDGPAGAGTQAGGLLSRLYSAYMNVQQALMRRFLPAPKRSSGNSPDDDTLIRLWSFLGPTTNRTALIAFALIGRVDLYLWAVVVPGNLWLAAAWYFQRRIDARAADGPAAAQEEPR